ncbi:hypothetical protein PIB30_099479 [Stylosanthes scabra]|uniref:Uncharacterized protein n=1 Tax=Stylosanthes scabra TaxID=79078 RepID=A0ABU6RY78_9FABA|nr:hypothetical protein [Stylosanthes scabra]
MRGLVEVRVIKFGRIWVYEVEESDRMVFGGPKTRYYALYPAVDSTSVVTLYGNVIKFESIVHKLLFYPKDLSATTTRGYILGFSGRQGYAYLLLTMPRN